MSCAAVVLLYDCLYDLELYSVDGLVGFLQSICFQPPPAVLSCLRTPLSCPALTVFASSRNRTPVGSQPPFSVWH